MFFWFFLTFFFLDFSISDCSFNRRQLPLNLSVPEFYPWFRWRSLCLEKRLISLRRRLRETTSALTLSFITKTKTKVKNLVICLGETEINCGWENGIRIVLIY